MHEDLMTKGTIADFDTQSALQTICDLDFIRVCGSDGERRGLDILVRRLDALGVGWRLHTFRDQWVTTDDPHLLVRGRKIAVQPAMEPSFRYGIDFHSDEARQVDVQAELGRADDGPGTIAVVTEYHQEQPIVPDALAQLIVFPFEPEMEPYLWAQQEEMRQRIPVAVIAPEDIPFVISALGEPAALRWTERNVEGEFHNLVAEIPGTAKPDEIVVMSAHLDSFPGTVGASDDAAGCAVLLEAAKWFANHPPARTVRLLWFTGEEVDARGSRAYLRDCVEEPSAIKLLVNVDSSLERQSGTFEVYTSDEDTYFWACQRLSLDGLEHFITEGGGTDARSFIAGGIPVFLVEAPCKQCPHLPDDTPENLDPQKLYFLGSVSLSAAAYAASGDMLSPAERQER